MSKKIISVILTVTIIMSCIIYFGAESNQPLLQDITDISLLTSIQNERNVDVSTSSICFLRMDPRMV